MAHDNLENNCNLTVAIACKPASKGTTLLRK